MTDAAAQPPAGPVGQPESRPDRRVMYAVTVVEDATGVEHRAECDARDFVAFERRFEGRVFGEAALTMEGQYFVAWSHLRRKGKIASSLSFDDFVERWLLLGEPEPEPATTRVAAVHDGAEPDPTPPGA